MMIDESVATGMVCAKREGLAIRHLLADARARLSSATGSPTRSLSLGVVHRRTRVAASRRMALGSDGSAASHEARRERQCEAVGPSRSTGSLSKRVASPRPTRRQRIVTAQQSSIASGHEPGAASGCDQRHHRSVDGTTSPAVNPSRGIRVSTAVGASSAVSAPGAAFTGTGRQRQVASALMMWVSRGASLLPPPCFLADSDERPRREWRSAAARGVMHGDEVGQGLTCIAAIHVNRRRREGCFDSRPRERELRARAPAWPGPDRWRRPLFVGRKDA